jgi:hypothetical protein
MFMMLQRRDAPLAVEDRDMNASDSRREFVKRAAYIAPAILSLAVAPAYAKSGSDKEQNPDKPQQPHDKGDD